MNKENVLQSRLCLIAGKKLKSKQVLTIIMLRMPFWMDEK